ncbi:MAG: hypothetical protein R6U17_09520 [Thermoplasmata archaeon]
MTIPSYSPETNATGKHTGGGSGKERKYHGHRKKFAVQKNNPIHPR